MTIFNMSARKAWSAFLLPDGGYDIAVTLTLRQSQYVDGVHYRITREKASDNVRHFLNRMNAKVYSNAYKRYDKKLTVINSIEGGEDGKRWHVHLAIKYPEYLIENTSSRSLFTEWLRNEWRKTHWGYDIDDIQICHDDEGWVNYIIKEGADSIDITNANL